MSEARYRTELRAPVRGVWAGTIDVGTFYDMFITAIRVGLTRAFHKGLEAGGISPDEMSKEEQAYLTRAITEQYGYITGFATAIAENTKAQGGKLTPLLNRVELWVQAYTVVYNQGRSFADIDGKYMWILGSTKEHCESCLRLNGKVKRISYWQAHIMPRTRPLDCGGWRCQCNLEPTTEPLSRGILPGGF